VGTKQLGFSSEAGLGKLYLVSTPIGNLKDITLRAIEVLKDVELILCEDTRHAQKLLNEYQITTPRDSFHDHNKEKKTPKIIRLLREGKNIALISDAGTPGISDPGFYLVREAIKNCIPIIPIPGPTAFVPALVISGLPTDRFVFEGFLPRKKGKRRKRLEELRQENRTIILYESPYRLKDTLRELFEVLGEDRQICLVRELTKIHEEAIRGKLSEIIKLVEEGEVLLKGELVLVVEGKQSS
jgi:16S rRNA (cytidine1402-2'-O)-methyltransferase